METELKFALSPDARRRIEQHAGHHVLAGEQGSTHNDQTTYFDTPDQALRKAGFTLRIRHRREANSYIQNVKASGGNNGAFSRREWEWPVKSDRLETDHLAEVPGLPPLLHGDAASLSPLFRTEVERRQRILVPAPGVEVEMALDDGVVVAGNHSEPLSELELELKKGSDEALFRLGLDFLQAAPLSLLVESKAERGYHLHDGSRPQARKARRIELAPDMGVHQAFRTLGAGVIGDLLANQPAALRGEEQEGVHQMRVGIRRLRSLLVLFERFLEPHVSDRFDAELRRLGQVLGVARDWDVFLGEMLPRAVREGADLEWIEPLRAAALHKQHAAHQAAKKAIGEPAFTRFVLAFQAWSGSGDATLPHRLIDRSLGDLAPRLLDRVARKVSKRLGQSDPDDPESLHDLRKSAKKLRYAIQYLEDLYGKKARRYYKRCDRLQTRLGEINDLDTLTRLAADLTQDGRLDLAPALGLLANLGETMTARELKGLDKLLARFEREEPFWR